jgi:hypothetical protein
VPQGVWVREKHEGDGSTSAIDQTLLVLSARRLPPVGSRGLSRNNKIPLPISRRKWRRGPGSIALAPWARHPSEQRRGRIRTPHSIALPAVEAVKSCGAGIAAQAKRAREASELVGHVSRTDTAAFCQHMHICSRTAPLAHVEHPAVHQAITSCHKQVSRHRRRAAGTYRHSPSRQRNRGKNSGHCHRCARATPAAAPRCRVQTWCPETPTLPTGPGPWPRPPPAPLLVLVITPLLHIPFSRALRGERRTDTASQRARGQGDEGEEARGGQGEAETCDGRQSTARA